MNSFDYILESVVDNLNSKWLYLHKEIREGIHIWSYGQFILGGKKIVPKFYLQLPYLPESEQLECDAIVTCLFFQDFLQVSQKLTHYQGGHILSGPLKPTIQLSFMY